MDDAIRQRLIEETRGMAEALVDDLRHIRQVLDDPAMLKRDVRHLAHIARRLLVDGGQGELSRVAAPRTGRITIPAPNNERWYRIQEAMPGLIQWVSGGATIATVTASGISLMEGAFDPAAMVAALRSPAPEQLLNLRLHEFMDQRVTYFRGIWGTRRLVIDYVANVGHAVHSVAIDTPDRQALASLATLTKVGIQILDSPSDTEVPREKACDGVSYEMLCTLHFVAQAPDVRELEDVIEKEVGL